MNSRKRRREAVFVVGSGRSGTSTITGILRRLGLHVPAPEVPADPSNPRGFNEPQWMVDTHDAVLRRAGVAVADPRPGAASDVARVASEISTAATAAVWLDEQFRRADHLVLKDPRLIWFIGPWRQAAGAAGAHASFVTMLRSPAEVTGSKSAYYGPQQAADGIAMWVNGMLRTEHATRGVPRAFVRYDELLAGWRGPITRTATTLGIEHAVRDDDAAHRAVDEFVDPRLHRVSAGWEDLEIPDYLRDVAERTWAHLTSLTGAGDDTIAGYATADELREQFADAHARLEEASAYRRTRKLVPRRALAMIPPRLRSRLGRAARQIIEDRV
ncbi:sulfotransferase family protein [Myceligenerans crystallogenes]|uniref:Sulfotransferase family protein n=1 Tax=Myceligenerans crystallogenes TaxID=316335 RepID=A0ABP4ZJI2_9MICO